VADQPERYYRVDIQFRNGASERQADHLIRFTYTGRSGEEVPLYLVPAQVAGIVVEERYSA
jgi:hypothetical protein